MMAVIPGVPPRATWRAVPTSTPVLQLVLVILEKKSTNNPFIAFTNTAGQTFNGTTSQGICVSASLEQFFCTWLSHSSSLERARSEVVTWCCGVLLHPALEWPKLRFETTHPVETLRVSHPILLYFFFLFFIFISSRSTIGSCWIARYFFLSFFFFSVTVGQIDRTFRNANDRSWLLYRGGPISRIYPVGRDLYARSTIDNSICNRAGLETCGYSWHEKRFRSVAKIELSILSRGWKLDGRMETRIYVYEGWSATAMRLFICYSHRLFNEWQSRTYTPVVIACQIYFRSPTRPSSKFQQPQVPSIDRC